MSTLKSKRAKKPRPTGKAPGSSSSAQSSSSKKAQVYDTVNVGLDFVANLSEASDVLAPLKAACRATKSILDVKQAIDSNKEDLNDLIARLEGYMSSIEKQVDLFERYSPEERIVEEAFSQPFIRYVKFLEDLSAKVLNYVEKRSQTTRGRATQVRKVKIDAETIRRFSREVDDRHRQFMEALNIFTTLRIQSIERSTKDTKVNVEKSLTDNDATAILQLPMVAFVPSSIHNTCMQGTREAVLQMIWHWASDDISDKPIFWLCDIAGSGKSTVAMSAAERWRNEGILGGRFFFSIASSEGSTTEKFCSTIARELAYYIPGHGRSIADAVRRNPIVMRSSLDEQFRTLITGSLHSQQDRVIFVIDALDECKSGSQRKELVEALYTAVRECKNLKIFMTSRPDPVVEAILGSLSTKAKLEDRLHHVNHRDNIDDIANYVHRSLGGILPGDKRQKLVEKANGLFIWASTACRMLKNEASLISPEDMYARLTSMDQVGVIDDVYNLVFERTDPEYYTVLCTMLALLAAAFEPLTIDDLDDLLKSSKIHGSAKALVHNLGSVLTIDATNLIQFRHPTVVEYLRRCPINPAINNRNIISINFANAHGQTALWCLKRLKSPSEGLKFNICQIESSFNLNRQIPDLDTRVSNFISRRLRYASSHWVFHVAETNDNWRYTFSSELEHITQIPYVLYWMEILSFTGGVPRAIAGLRAIAHHAGVSD
ncbi:related to archipelago beta form (F-box-WD40 repeat protein) [Serendipita indica DSM 11827]|uniref:Related to archipelago beta form (F-box-WD40 repeat protein) n=1 Tax=Serendipita indica (strain DSM 11827) TaxID=1109443 RepID=G4TC71_SERID|nr:related to archipelago beta form (F-box-WD40 repeat protein) [Serendipita indica DSM 11827]